MAADAGYNEATVAFHEGDTYNPIEAEELDREAPRPGLR